MNLLWLNMKCTSLGSAEHRVRELCSLAGLSQICDNDYVNHPMNDLHGFLWPMRASYSMTWMTFATTVVESTHGTKSGHPGFGRRGAERFLSSRLETTSKFTLVTDTVFCLANALSVGLELDVPKGPLHFRRMLRTPTCDPKVASHFRG